MCIFATSCSASGRCSRLHSRTWFFVTAQDMSVEFQKVGDDKANGFSLKRGNNTYVATPAQ